jgi:uncharacterized protein
MIICEMIKQKFNKGQPNNCYFWRDKTGHEIDCLVDNGKFLSPMEIKSGQTITANYCKGLDYFSKIAGSRASKPYLIYGGLNNQCRTNSEVLSWSRLDKLNF